MKHAIQVHEDAAFGLAMADAIEKCVHCGFCLPVCPTYQVLGQEMDSPRGRIVLMKEVLEKNLDLEMAAPHVDACLGCLACETACPSGVPYRNLISPFRASAQEKTRRPMTDRLRRFVVGRTLPFPSRFRLALRLGRFAKRFRRCLPKGMQPMFDLLPQQFPKQQQWPDKIAAQGERRARVALLAGCAQQVLAPDINAATIEVLTRNGVEVVIPANQSCCGALDWHTGNLKRAQRLAQQNVAAFPQDVDAIVTNAAGCGAGMHEYPLILRGTALESAAKAMATRVCDVTVFLDRLGLQVPVPVQQREVRIAYQDACHLLHGQGEGLAPRKLLSRIPGAKLIGVDEAGLCCGSAGTYNLDQPEIAQALGKRKAQHILSVNPDLVVSGNIGCITQLGFHLAQLGSALPVKHTMQVLRDAYGRG